MNYTANALINFWLSFFFMKFCLLYTDKYSFIPIFAEKPIFQEFFLLFHTKYSSNLLYGENKTIKKFLQRMSNFQLKHKKKLWLRITFYKGKTLILEILNYLGRFQKIIKFSLFNIDNRNYLSLRYRGWKARANWSTLRKSHVSCFFFYLCMTISTKFKNVNVGIFYSRKYFFEKGQTWALKKVT